MGHLVDGGIVEGPEFDGGHRALRRQRSNQSEGGRRLVAAQGDDADDGLGADIVGQILDDGEGLGVGPVEIFEDQQACAVACHHSQ